MISASILTPILTPIFPLWTGLKRFKTAFFLSTRQKKNPEIKDFQGFLNMDLRGIEPLSESLSLKASPITVADLTFPRQYAHRQAYCFSSFMIHLPGQSLPGKVSHMVDARFPMCECNGADEQLRLLTLTFRLRLYLVPGWYAVQESADGFPNFKAPVETSTSP